MSIEYQCFHYTQNGYCTNHRRSSNKCLMIQKEKCPMYIEGTKFTTKSTIRINTDVSTTINEENIKLIGRTGQILSSYKTLKPFYNVYIPSLGIAIKIEEDNLEYLNNRNKANEI